MLSAPKYSFLARLNITVIWPAGTWLLQQLHAQQKHFKGLCGSNYRVRKNCRVLHFKAKENPWDLVPARSLQRFELAELKNLKIPLIINIFSLPALAVWTADCLLTFALSGGRSNALTQHLIITSTKEDKDAVSIFPQAQFLNFRWGFHPTSLTSFSHDRCQKPAFQLHNVKKLRFLAPLDIFFFFWGSILSLMAMISFTSSL